MHRVGFTKFFIVALLSGVMSSAIRAQEVAQVPETLKSDQAYATYAKIMIELSLLGNPATAAIPVFVDTPLPGVIDLRGTVPSQRIKEHVVQTAVRISGLRVRQTLKVVNDTPEFKETNEDRTARLGLAKSTSETLKLLFADAALNLQVTATTEGVVTLNGTASSYETCLLLSQAVKSQPGCRAVQCRLQVPATSETQKLRVLEDGSQQLFAAQLPAIPTAQSLSLTAGTEKAIDRPPAIRVAADDAPPVDQADRQVMDEIKARFDKDPELSKLKFEIEVQTGQVSLLGNTTTRAQVELAVANASEVPKVTKVIAKTRPISIQRYRPTRYDATDKKNEPYPLVSKPKKLFGYIPIPFTSETTSITPTAQVSNRRFRDSLKKLLQKRAERDAENISVKTTSDGKVLLIEGKVATPQKRIAMFKILDNLPQLRDVPYDCVLSITESD